MKYRMLDLLELMFSVFHRCLIPDWGRNTDRDPLSTTTAAGEKSRSGTPNPGRRVFKSDHIFSQLAQPRWGWCAIPSTLQDVRDGLNVPPPTGPWHKPSLWFGVQIW